MSEPLRVLQVLAPTRAGGLESVVIQLASGLKSHGHDVQVVAVLENNPRGGGESKIGNGDLQSHPVVQALKARGVPVHMLTIGARDYLAERRAVRRLLHDLRANVLHTHGFRPDVVLGDVARRMGTAHIMTLHGFIGASPRGRLYEWLQIQAGRFASSVLAVSKPIQDRLAQHGISRNVHLVRNAVTSVTSPLSREEARASLGLPADVGLVGWVGRLSREKGPDLFVQALARVASGVHGVILGDGPMLNEVRALGETLGIGSRLHCVGLVPEANRYLSALDILALTSRTEGTPMILLESMWAGIPIVTAAVGGVPDILSEREAVLTLPECPDSIAAAIELSFRDMVRAEQRASQARSRVERDHSPSSWLIEHEKIYRSHL